MTRQVSLLSVALAATACSGTEAVNLSLLRPSGSQSAIVATSAGEDIAVYASAVPPQDHVQLQVLAPYIGAYEVEVTVLFFDQPLTALGLAPGELSPANPLGPGQPLPRNASSIQTASVRGGDVDAWRELEPTALPGTVDGFRIAGFDPRDCILGGGCVDLSSGAAQCANPCPDRTPIEPIADPAPPNFLPCPAGWQQQDVAGVAVCVPWLAGLPTCADDEMAIPGEAGCTQVGSPCPAGRFRTDLPAGRSLFVDAGAPAGGDGSMGAPFQQIEDATAEAAAGDTIVLAKGRYEESVTMPAGVDLLGACASETIIDSKSSNIAAGVQSGSGVVTVRDVTVASLDDGIRARGAGCRLIVEDSIVRDARIALTAESGGQLEARRTLLRDNRRYGVYASGASNTVVFESGQIRRATRGGVLVASDATARVTDTVINATRSDPEDDNKFGRGGEADGGASLEMTRCALLDNVNTGIYSKEGSVTLDHVVIQDTAPSDFSNTSGHGLYASTQSSISGQRVFLDRNHTASVQSQGGEIDLADVVSNEPQSVASGMNLQFGWGARVGNAGTLRLTRALVAASTEYAIGAGVISDRTPEDLRTIELTDIRVVDTRGGIGPVRNAYDVFVQSGTNFTLRSALLGTSAGTAIRVEGIDAAATLEDLTVESHGVGGCLNCAGVCVREGAQATLKRGTVSGVHGRSIDVSERSPPDLDGEPGVAALLNAEDLTVRDARGPGTCAPGATSRNVDTDGEALSTRAGGRLNVTRFLVDGAASSAARVHGYADPSNQLTMNDGTIREAPTGLFIQIPGFPIETSLDRVAFENVVAPVYLQNP